MIHLQYKILQTTFVENHGSLPLPTHLCEKNKRDSDNFLQRLVSVSMPASVLSLSLESVL